MKPPIAAPVVDMAPRSRRAPSEFSPLNVICFLVVLVGTPVALTIGGLFLWDGVEAIRSGTYALSKTAIGDLRDGGPYFVAALFIVIMGAWGLTANR